MDQVKFFGGYLPQILFGPFLNTLTQMPVNPGRFELQTSYIKYSELKVSQFKPVVTEIL